jgi:hypothetical protein
MLKYFAILIFVILAVTYYFLPVEATNTAQTFLTISTFLFAIFTGFFISRQGKRYTSIRDQIAIFDGELTSCYRQFGHLGKAAQKASAKIIKQHYEKIVKNNAWDYHFNNKSNTITSLHQLAEKHSGNKPLPSLKHLALQRVLTALETLQRSRKSMVSLYTERIPRFQWILVDLLAVILFITVSTIPSEGYFLGAILKGAFCSSVIFIIILLREFDRLNFFEKTIGEHSAKDILEILSGKK